VVADVGAVRLIDRRIVRTLSNEQFQ
jgi:hypothetical protein